MVRRRTPGTSREQAERLAAATPSHRDRYVDLLRAVAIAMVVVGHWLTSAVTVTDGRLGAVNLLYVVPWAQPVTWLFQVMPLFFLVGGYANAASLTKHRERGGTSAAWVQSRALRLLRPTAVLVVVLVIGYAVALALGADQEVTRTAVWAAGVGLWFLVVYLAVVALAPAVIGWQRRRGAGVIVTLVALVGAGDVARVVTGSDAPATASYVLGWLAVHQLGVAWRDGALTRTRRPAVALAAGGAVVAAGLVALGPYGVSMVGAVAGPDLSNSDPPTLALLALAAMQTGIALLLRPAIDPWLQRPRAWQAVVGVNAIILTIFLWHMVPVVIAGAALMTTGLFPQPEVGSGVWFALRVPWLAILGLVLTALVAAFARFETGARRRPDGTPSGVVVGLGVVACVAALAGIGVTGVDGVLPPVWGLPLGELAVFGVGLTVVWRAGGSRDGGSRDGGSRDGGRTLRLRAVRSRPNVGTTHPSTTQEQHMSHLTGKTVAFLATNGFEDSELTSPWQALTEHGARAVLVAPQGGTITGKNGHEAHVDEPVGQADASRFDALVLPGGVKNGDTIRMDADAVRFAKAFFEQHKPVGVICHGGWILTDADVVRGRTLTSYPSLRTDLRNAGATWVDEEVVVDSGLVSSRTPDDLPAFNAKLVEEISEGKHERQTA